MAGVERNFSRKGKKHYAYKEDWRLPPIPSSSPPAAVPISPVTAASPSSSVVVENQSRSPFLDFDFGFGKTDDIPTSVPIPVPTTKAFPHHPHPEVMGNIKSKVKDCICYRNPMAPHSDTSTQDTIDSINLPHRARGFSRSPAVRPAEDVPVSSVGRHRGPQGPVFPDSPGTPCPEPVSHVPRGVKLGRAMMEGSPSTTATTTDVTPPSLPGPSTTRQMARGAENKGSRGAIARSPPRYPPAGRYGIYNLTEAPSASSIQAQAGTPPLRQKEHFQKERHPFAAFTAYRGSGEGSSPRRLTKSPRRRATLANITKGLKEEEKKEVEQSKEV
ncbi:hypothetical protein AA313_de0200367 [Arthrobotrys entomopaga]|nr:hypothetical protein AA313_de0200367 [Arthrobotrys entomopaga]